MSFVSKINTFRELNPAEIAKVSGGLGGFIDDDKIIVVTGERPDPWVTSIPREAWLGLQGDAWISTSNLYEGDYGDGGGEHEHCPRQSSMSASEAEQTESVAQKAQALINAKAEDGNEHGYFIIRDSDGNVTLGAYHLGNESEIDFGGDGLALSETGAGSWDDVLGFVHNHPTTEDLSFVTGDPNKWNRTPSGPDWQILDAINGVNENENFTLYIMDEDGNLRAYDADSKRGRNSATDVIEPEGGHQCSST